MSHIPANNPKTGISITGILLGVLVEKSRDGNFTNYRLGIGTESRPDKFGQVTHVTNEVELTESQHQRFSSSVMQNRNQPVRIWVELDHRAGEKNGRVWDILNLRMRPDSEIEYLEGSASVEPIKSALPEGVKASK